MKGAGLADPESSTGFDLGRQTGRTRAARRPVALTIPGIVDYLFPLTGRDLSRV